MRLTDFENDEALEKLADIIEPATMIMSDNKVAEMVRSGKPVLLTTSYILKKHKKPVTEIISCLHGENPSTYKFNMATLFKDVIDILNDPSLIDLFTSQGQKMPYENSGSAMENTKDEEQ